MTLDEEIKETIEKCLSSRVWIYPRTKNLTSAIKQAIWRRINKQDPVRFMLDSNNYVYLRKDDIKDVFGIVQKK